MRGRRDTEPRSWVTRERPKIDRIACPWLIRRFIDAEAEFVFVPTERVFPVAAETGATAYDIPGAEPFSHDGELCSFDAFLKVYGIKDPALDTLALIVRGADTARLELAVARRHRVGDEHQIELAALSGLRDLGVVSAVSAGEAVASAAAPEHWCLRRVRAAT